jgi:TnpA family transposase
MPVSFLTEAQRQRYGCYAGEPTSEQLALYFYLNDTDRSLIIRCRGQHHRLGFAVQLCSVRFLGTFLVNPIDVPSGVISHLANQLQVSNPACLSRYLERSNTHWEHAQEIRQHGGYREFSDQPERWRFIRWLYGRAWVGTEAPSVLFDLATAQLVERKLLLPGVTILERLVSSVRERVANRVWCQLARLPNANQQSRLEALLLASEKTRQTPLDRLRRSPTRWSAPALIDALNRLSQVRELEVSHLNFFRIPPSRVKALSRTAFTVRAQAIARMPVERRIATLLAFAHEMEAIAQDDVLDMLELLIKELLAKSVREGKKERLRTLKDLDAAALRLGEACTILLNSEETDGTVREAIFTRIPQAKLAEAIAQVEALARPSEDQYYPEVMARWRQVRLFLPLLLKTIDFQANKAGQSMLVALQFLKSIEGKHRPKLKAAPLNIISKGWLRWVVLPNGEIDRCAYTFCVLEQLMEGLTRRDVFVTPSVRWSNPHAKLLQGEAWETARAQVCRTLNLEATPKPELQKLAQQLHEAYQQTAHNLPTNAAVRIEREKGRDTLSIRNLDKLEESAHLLALRYQVTTLLPYVDLPEAILEIHAKTQFLNEFTHVNDESIRAADLPVSLCAALIASACNIGLRPVVRQEIPALARHRLNWVQQHYIRAETLTAANARLVDAQAQIPLAQAWGGGDVASADGVRFVVPVRTLNAGPNSKYFGRGRGITYYNFTSDQFTGFHGLVVPGTLRDSLVVLMGLLEQRTSLRPREIMTDTSGYSDMVFGLFWLLGYQFSPRLADAGEARFWRLDREADYGVLNGLARQRVKTELIEASWDDMLRVAGSLKLGTVSALEIMRALQRGGKPSTLGKAIGDLGRIAKTVYLLHYVDDASYRRRILTQLKRGEGRHSLARTVCYGQKGEIRQRYREGQEDQLNTLGLVVNVLVLWNTFYMNAALQHLQAQGLEINLEDVARLSPLAHTHINVLGRYQFDVSEAIQQGGSRPLRNPSDPKEYD